MQITPTTLEVVKENREFTIAVVPPYAIDNVWRWLREKLEEQPELWNRAHTMESLRLQIETGQITVWIVVKNGYIYMAFFTVVTMYPVMNTLDVVWASGKELERYIGIGLAGLEDFAKRHNCAEINVCAARLGWSKPLAPFGYRRTQTTFTKTLSNERLN